MKESSPVVFLSIHPQWAEKILERNKEFEYRRAAPTLDPPYKVLLYSTNGASEIVGEVSVDRVLSDTIENLLERTIDDTPHTQEEIEEYFEGAEVGQALHISDVIRYDEPIQKEAIEGVLEEFRPPQNFLYLSPDSNPEFFELIPTYRMQSTQGTLSHFETS